MRVLVIEDDERVASLIKRGLEELQYEALLAYDGLMGKKLAGSQHFDIIIMDVILPKIDGLSLCKELRSAKPHTPIIMLTALGTTDDKVEGFDAGADDYLVKPFDFRELHARIKALHKRSHMLRQQPLSTLKAADLEMNLQRKTASRGGKEIHLTPKEFKLLEYMLINQGRVLSRTEIAEKVWGMTFDTGTNFIDVYINYLRKKIDKAYQEKLIHTKSGMGFILKASHEDTK